MTPSTERLERLQKQEEQLKARIQQERAKLNKAANKQRTGKLIAWGVVVEQLLQDGSFEADWWKLQCKRVLSGRTLERALMPLTAETSHFRSSTIAQIVDSP